MIVLIFFLIGGFGGCKVCVFIFGVEVGDE